MVFCLLLSVVVTLDSLVPVLVFVFFSVSVLVFLFPFFEVASEPELDELELLPEFVFVLGLLASELVFVLDEPVFSVSVFCLFSFVVIIVAAGSKSKSSLVVVSNEFVDVVGLFVVELFSLLNSLPLCLLQIVGIVPCKKYSSYGFTHPVLAFLPVSEHTVTFATPNGFSNLALFLNTRPTPCSNPVIFGHRLYNGDSSSIIG